MYDTEHNALVSVIIPTCNRRDLVLATLQSVFQQTYSHYEVLVVDDGSTDDTATALAPLAASGRIRYIAQSNGGVARARNTGIAASKGSFLAFLDDDDLWPPDKLRWQVEYLEAHPEIGIVGGTCILFTTPFEEIGYHGGPQRVVEFEEMFCGSPYSSPGQTLIRRSILEKIGLFDTDIWAVDDLDLYMRISRVSKAAFLPHLSLYYRQHSNSVSKNLSRMLFNGKKTIHKNLPFVDISQRKRASIESSFWLYQYLGKQAVRECRTALSQKNLGAASRHLASVWPLVWDLLTIPSLGRMFLRDLIKTRPPHAGAGG